MLVYSPSIGTLSVNTQRQHSAFLLYRGGGQLYSQKVTRAKDKVPIPVNHANWHGPSFINVHHQPRFIRHLKKTNSIFLSTLNCLGIFVENQLTLFLNSLLCSIDLYTSTLSPIPNYPDNCDLKSCRLGAPTLFCFKNIIWLGIMHFHTNFKTQLVNLYKMSAGIFYWECIESIDHFGKNGHILSLSIHEHAVSFHFFRSF